MQYLLEDLEKYEKAIKIARKLQREWRIRENHPETGFNINLIVDATKRVNFSTEDMRRWASAKIKAALYEELEKRELARGRRERKKLYQQKPKGPR